MKTPEQLKGTISLTSNDAEVEVYLVLIRLLGQSDSDKS